MGDLRGTAAIQKFVESGLPTLGQILVQSAGSGAYELRHQLDHDVERAALKTVEPNDLRNLVQSTSTGAFRPLKSAPNLQQGWRCHAKNLAELEVALGILYPGAIADWFAIQSAAGRATDFREFTSRQTGMYRITATLNDPQAGEVIAACCHVSLCLKRRLWTVEGMAVDGEADKSVIPCLEPCAIFMELARKQVRLRQAAAVEVALSEEELLTLTSSLNALASMASGREGQVADPNNARRARLLLERLGKVKVPGESQGTNEQSK